MPEIGLGIFRPLYYSPDLLWRWKAGWAGGSFARASAAWYIGADGILRQAVAGVPRIEWYDLDGDGMHESPALRLEPARTNALSWSEDFTQSVWGKYQSSVVAGATTAPDGTMSGTLLLDNSVSDSHQVQRSFTTFPDNTDYVASIFVKARDYTWCCVSFRNKDNVSQRAFFDLANGTIGMVQNAAAAWIEPYPNGWYRVSVRGNTGSGPNPVFVFYQIARSNGTVSFAGDGASGIYIWGAQFEAGPAATSYIRTGGSTVTRAADMLTFPWPHAPHAMTGYLRFIETGAVVMASANATLFRLGTTPQGRIMVERVGNDRRYRCSYRRDDSTAVVASVLPMSPVPAIGDRVELLWRLYADGSVQIEQAINGGAPVVAARSSAVGLPTEWSGQIMRLSGTPLGAGEAPAAWRDALICKGTDITWDEVRAIVGA